MMETTMNDREILNAMNEEIKAAEEALLYLKQSKARFERVIANSKKSPVEEAYKKVYGVYPIDSIDETWHPFQAGYNAAKEDVRVEEPEQGTWNYDPDAKFGEQEPEENEWKNVALKFGKKLPVILPYSYDELSPNAWYRWVVFTYDSYMKQRDKECGYNTPKSQEQVEKLQEKDWKVDVKTNLKSHWEPTPQEPEEVEGLKEAFREAVKQGVVSSSTKPQTLYEICMDWWRELYSTADMNISIEKLVNRIEKEWLPTANEETCGMKDWDSAWTIGYNNYRNTLMENLK